MGSLGGVIWDARNEQMKDELITFEERTCPRIPGDPLQEKIDDYKRGNEGDFHQFVHGIVFDLAEDPNKPSGNSLSEVVNSKDKPENTNDGSQHCDNEVQIVNEK